MPIVTKQGHTPRGLHRRNWALSAKFALVGVSGVLVNMLTTAIAHKLHGGPQHAHDVVFRTPVTGWPCDFSTLVWFLGFQAASLSNFQLHRVWSLDGDAPGSWWGDYRPILLIGFGVAIVGAVVKFALANPDSSVGLPRTVFTGEKGISAAEYWAQLLAILATIPLNFLALKAWTYTRARRHPSTVPMLAPLVAPELVDSIEYPGDLEDRAEVESADHRPEAER